MKKYNFILGFFMCISIFACKENEDVWYTYSETYCADAWETGSGSEETVVLESVENYLESKGVRVAEVDLNDMEVGATCMACTCLSGRIIRVRSTSGDEGVLLEEGFIVE
ncbi:MAG: hypothetical protein ACPG5P_02030 [Saprospiraceae bacterium]